MRIERYYSSVKEEISPLSNDAYTLLDKQDYVGFFKSCGSNYVRSIRRAQEVIAIFKFHSSSSTVAAEFAVGLKVSGWGSRVESNFSYKSKFSSIASSLEIKILGFGMGLNEEGSDTLVATSLDEYNEVMKFAFRSMTQSENSAHIGMIYGIEVVPWVDNTAFQVASKLLDEDILIPQRRSVIPKARNRLSSDTTAFKNDATTRALFKCKKPEFQIDKYGYCCDESSLMNTRTGNYEPERALASPSSEVEDNTENAEDTTEDTTEDTREKDISERVCKPRSKLDKSLVKNNMAANGEFVALLDSIVRYKLNQLFTLSKCISAVRAIPDKYEYYILKSQDTVKYDATIEATFTVNELKRALDPASDYRFLKFLGQELDEFMDMYYEPCIAALFGSNIGYDPDVEAQYFMAYPWQFHDECNQLSCLADNMRWNRNGEGCVPSLVTGSGSDSYDAGADCTKEEGDDFYYEDEQPADEAEKCKTSNTDMEKFRTDAKACWEGIGFNVVPIHLMDHFCMPQITANIADETRIEKLEASKCSEKKEEKVVAE